MDPRERRRRALIAYWRKVEEAHRQRKISRGAFSTIHHLAEICRKYSWEDFELEMGVRQMSREVGCTGETLIRHRKLLEKAGLVRWIPNENRRKRGFWASWKLKLTVDFSLGRSVPISGTESVPKTGTESVPKTEPLTNNLSLRDPLLRNSDKELKAIARSSSLRSEGGGGKSSSLRSEYGLDPEEDCNAPLGRSPQGCPAGPKGEAFRGGTRGAGGETELMGRIRTLLGSAAMANDGGKWRNRVRTDPEKVERLLAEARSFTNEGGKIHKPAAWMEDTWRRWN